MTKTSQSYTIPVQFSKSIRASSHGRDNMNDKNNAANYHASTSSGHDDDEDGGLHHVFDPDEWNEFATNYDEIVVDNYNMVDTVKCISLVLGPCAGIFITILGAITSTAHTRKKAKKRMIWHFLLDEHAA